VALLPVLDHLREQYPAFEYKTGVEMVRSEIANSRNKYFWDAVNQGSASDAGLMR
jgi:hypothetical protein